MLKDKTSLISFVHSHYSQRPQLKDKGRYVSEFSSCIYNCLFGSNDVGEETGTNTWSFYTKHFILFYDFRSTEIYWDTSGLSSPPTVKNRRQKGETNHNPWTLVLVTSQGKYDSPEPTYRRPVLVRRLSSRQNLSHYRRSNPRPSPTWKNAHLTINEHLNIVNVHVRPA